VIDIVLGIGPSVAMRYKRSAECYSRWRLSGVDGDGEGGLSSGRFLMGEARGAQLPAREVFRHSAAHVLAVADFCDAKDARRCVRSLCAHVSSRVARLRVAWAWAAAWTRSSWLAQMYTSLFTSCQRRNVGGRYEQSF
jgi:hypothetical protein